jgi:hypothetical protein
MTCGISFQPNNARCQTPFHPQHDERQMQYKNRI